MIAPKMLENWFTYHAPTSNQLVAYSKLRNAAHEFAKAINELVPDCADKTAAMRKVREAVMTANAAIACPDPWVAPVEPLKPREADIDVLI